MNNAFQSSSKLTSKAIRVHGWGGFGSQLFTLIIAKRLSQKFPNRKIEVIFHSSGVTARGIEIPSALLTNMNVEFCDDFIISQFSSKTSHYSKLKSQMKLFFVKALERSGFLSRLETESDFKRIRPWLMEVRGHYTNFALSSDELIWLFHLLDLPSQEMADYSLNKVVIHFRLGDLLNLDSKTHIPVSRIREALNKVNNVKEISIYSDSTLSEVKQIVGSELSSYRVSIFNVETLYVLRECMEARVFVGTTSKISLWISIFRIFRGLGETTLLPSELSQKVKVMTKDIQLKKQISEF